MRTWSKGPAGNDIATDWVELNRSEKKVNHFGDDVYEWSLSAEDVLRLFGSRDAGAERRVCEFDLQTVQDGEPEPKWYSKTVRPCYSF